MIGGFSGMAVNRPAATSCVTATYASTVVTSVIQYIFFHCNSQIIIARSSFRYTSSTFCAQQ
jgi:hypothetical protein